MPELELPLLAALGHFGLPAHRYRLLFRLAVVEDVAVVAVEEIAGPAPVIENAAVDRTSF